MTTSSSQSTTKQTFFTMMYKASLSFIGLISSLISARYLNPGDRNLLQLAGTYAQTGMYAVGGFTNYYSYIVAKRPEQREVAVQTGNVFVFGLSVLIWLIALILAWIGIPAFRPNSPWLWAFLVTPLMFIFGYGSRLLQATNEMSWLNRANTAQPVLFILIMLPFLFYGRLSEPLRLLISFGSWTATFAVAAFATLVIGYRVLRVPGATKWRFNRLEWRNSLGYGGWSAVGNVVNYVNYRMDYWWVSFFFTGRLSYIASVYGIAVTASEVLLNASGSLLQVVFTRMTGGTRLEAIRITEMSARQTILTSAITAVAMYLIFPWLIPFAFGAKYAPALWPFYFLLPGLIIKAASNIIIQFATNTLGQPKTAIWMNGVSAMINAGCCVLLIPMYGLVGGAIASTASYAISYVIYVVWFVRVTKSPWTQLWLIRKTDLVPYAKIVRRLVRR